MVIGTYTSRERRKKLFFYSLSSFYYISIVKFESSSHIIIKKKERTSRASYTFVCHVHRVEMNRKWFSAVQAPVCDHIFPRLSEMAHFRRQSLPQCRGASRGCSETTNRTMVMHCILISHMRCHFESQNHNFDLWTHHSLLTSWISRSHYAVMCVIQPRGMTYNNFFFPRKFIFCVCSTSLTHQSRRKKKRAHEKFNQIACLCTHSNNNLDWGKLPI